MATETLPNNYLKPAGGRQAPPAAHPRTGRKPVRGSGGRRGAARRAMAALVVLLISLCGAPGTHANPAERVKKLRAAYALDESVEESDGALIRRQLLKLLSRSDVRLFLKVIQTAEAGEPDLMVGGCRAGSLKKHPALLLPRRCCYPVKGFGCSFAAGNYQLTLQNWRKIAPFLELRDFSELNQALAALELIRRGGGAADAYSEKGLAMKQRIQGGFLSLVTGDVNRALCAATNDWASSSCSTLPANNRVVYANLADEIRQREAARARRAREDARLQARQGKARDARVKIEPTLKPSGCTAEPGPRRAKAPKPGRTAARGKA